MKNILITGGCGFIGSNLAEQLIKNYNIIIIDDLSVGNINNLKKIKKNIKFIKADINKINSINYAIFKKIDAFIHLAAKAEIIISNNKEKKYFNDNVSSVMSSLIFCKKYNIKKFIFASSASVYGNSGVKKVRENSNLKPMHFYGFTKQVSENIIQNYCRINNINYTILRFFNVYGKRSNAVIGKFLQQKCQSKKITIYGSGEQKRDFIHVDFISKVIKKCLKLNISNNKIYNVGTGTSISINSLVKLLNHDYINLDKRFDDIEISIADNEKIRKDLKISFKTNFRLNLLNLEKWHKRFSPKVKISSIQKEKKIINIFNKKL